jgi:hypothetical protein
MKMKIEKICVTPYKSGSRAGEWRPFDLPDGAIVLNTYVFYGKTAPVSMTITVAVPA